MTLIFRFLNVGHGSSVVVERQAGDQRFFGVVDSNVVGDVEPRALTVLKTLGAERLSFVCLTHPHKDHYSGLYSILKHFSGKVSTLYTNPMGELIANKERLKKLSAHLSAVAKKTDGMAERRAAIEFLQILKWGTEDEAEWIELGGEHLQLAPAGFAGISINSLLPPRRNVGDYVRRIESGDAHMFGHIDDNQLSVALHFSLGGSSVILGGDGTEENWRGRRAFVARGGQSARAEAVNLPHHGSARDNPPEVISQLFVEHGSRYAISSANGLSHPSIDVIERLSDLGISPYCTNLHVACGATVTKLQAPGDLDPQLARVLREVSLEAKVVQACQGDIAVTIGDDGAMSVTPEYDSFCPFRKNGILAA